MYNRRPALGFPASRATSSRSPASVPATRQERRDLQDAFFDPMPRDGATAVGIAAGRKSMARILRDRRWLSPIRLADGRADRRVVRLRLQSSTIDPAGVATAVT
jgi:hypothetical protein